MKKYCFNKKPTNQQILSIAEKHNQEYLDYVKVWFADGRKQIYYNSEPILHYYLGYNKSYWYIDFCNSELNKEGIHFAWDIIRTKRVIIKK